MMGVATVIHWDRFVHTNVAFWLWAALYFSTPLLVFATFAESLWHTMLDAAAEYGVNISHSEDLA